MSPCRQHIRICSITSYGRSVNYRQRLETPVKLQDLRSVQHLVMFLQLQHSSRSVPRATANTTAEHLNVTLENGTTKINSMSYPWSSTGLERTLTATSNNAALHLHSITSCGNHPTELSSTSAKKKIAKRWPIIKLCPHLPNPLVANPRFANFAFLKTLV